MFSLSLPAKVLVDGMSMFEAHVIATLESIRTMLKRTLTRSVGAASTPWVNDPGITTEIEKSSELPSLLVKYYLKASTSSFMKVALSSEVLVLNDTLDERVVRDVCS
jgi:hypothetical protein